MAITLDQSDLGLFRTSNPSGISRLLFSNERCKHDKSGKIIWRDCSFLLQVNEDSRLFPKFHLSQNVAILHCLSGKEESLPLCLDRILTCVNLNNTALLLAPTKSANPKTAAVDTDINQLFQKRIQTKLKKDGIEAAFKPTVPLYFYSSPDNPYHSAFEEYCYD